MEGQTECAARIRIGTRGSRLALAQAAELRDRLAAAHEALREPGAIRIVAIRTAGDAARDRRLADIGGKGLFVKEIEAALAERRVDIAVHSAKDMETALAPGTRLAAILPREDPRDAFVSRRAPGLDGLPPGAVVGTASARRAALVLRRRPDLRTALLRGNVETRLAKVEAGAPDATLLAMAGLNRLGLAGRATRILSVEEMPPAAGQGAVAAQCRSADGGPDARIAEWLAAANDRESELRVRAERAMLAALGGSCRTPIAGHAAPAGAGRLRLEGHVLSEDGTRHRRAAETGPEDDPEALGRAVGEALLAAAGPGLFG